MSNFMSVDTFAASRLQRAMQRVDATAFLIAEAVTSGGDVHPGLLAEYEVARDALAAAIAENLAQITRLELDHQTLRSAS